MFYFASTDSADSCPKAEPQKQRGLALYALASRLQRYLVTYYFFGYFILGAM
jgi:hypothetical protein